jgi:uncharacterized protein
VAGADALQRLFQGGDQVALYCRIIIDKEDEADQIAREVMQSVRRTFITPFDRIDIQELIQSMDDAIDQINQTVKTITRFEVRQFDPLRQDMTKLAVEAAELAAKSMPLLLEIVTNVGSIATEREKRRPTGI